MRSTLIYTYHTEKVDIPNDFRSEFIHSMVVMRRAVAKYNQTGRKFSPRLILSMFSPGPYFP